MKRTDEALNVRVKTNEPQKCGYRLWRCAWGRVRVVSMKLPAALQAPPKRTGLKGHLKVYAQIGISERGKVGAWSVLRRYEVLARKADCITCLYPTESGAATVEAAVMAVEEQAPVGFESKNKRTVFIGSSMTKKGTPQRRYADYDSEEVAKESETAQR